MPKDTDISCSCGSCGSCSCEAAQCVGRTAACVVAPSIGLTSEYFVILPKLAPLFGSKCGLFCAAGFGATAAVSLAAGAVAYFAGYGITKSCENEPESNSINDASSSLLVPAQQQMQANYLVSESIQPSAPPPTYGSTGMSMGYSTKID